MVTGVTSPPASPERKARRFLSTGRDVGLEVGELSAICNRLVRNETERSSRSAVRLGRQFVERARESNRVELGVALRAHGWACLVAGHYEESERAYLEARRIYVRSPLERSRIDRILIDVYMYLGDFARATKHAHRAMRVFRDQRASDDLARTEVNYANVLHRLDRHREARTYYHRAAEYFAKQKADLPAAICRYNEANTHVQLFELETAEQLYTQARSVFLEHDHHLRAVGCLYGLAWLHLLQAKFHLALKELSECEEAYRKAAQPRECVLCLLDRAEVLLGLNLCIDAKDAARQAEREAARLGIRYEASKAAFFLGLSLLGVGKSSAAHKAFARAENGFQKDGNQSFQAAVAFYDLMRLRRKPEFIDQMKSLQQRISGGQLPLWEALCDLQLMSEHDQYDDSLARLKKNRAVASVPQIRARYLTRLGDCIAGAGDRSRAISLWTEAATIVSEIRADLPPVDMRSSFARQHRGPYTRLIDATCESDPMTAGSWFDRYCTAGIWSTDRSVMQNPQRRKTERALADLAGMVSALSSTVGRQPIRRHRSVGNVSSAQRRLEQQIRTELVGLRSSRSEDERRSHQHNDITLASRSGPVVQLHHAGSDLIAIVHEEGASRSRRFTGGSAMLQRFVNQWRYYVERSSHLDARQRRHGRRDESAFLEELHEKIWKPLELKDGTSRILLVAAGEAANLPWCALGSHGSCLTDRRPIVFAPSIQHHRAATESRTSSRRVCIFVGDKVGLKQSRREFAPLLQDESRSVTIIDPCRRADWPSNSTADIWHFTGHAVFRPDNPFYSSLVLYDGPIFAADFRLRRNRVNIAMLAACRTAQRSLLPGDESTGLIRAMLEMGARNVIASHWAVNDDSAAFWSRAFYSARLSGAPVSESVSLAGQSTRERYPLAYDWAAFSVYGAG